MRRVFGVDAIRPGQEEVVYSVISGREMLPAEREAQLREYEARRQT
jgi:hypothetical protein